MAVGTIAGTNVFNILFILALSAALRPLPLHLALVRLSHREGPAMRREFAEEYGLGGGLHRPDLWGVDVSRDIHWIDLPLAAAVAIAGYPVFKSACLVSRREGMTFVSVHIVYLGSLLMLRRGISGRPRAVPSARRMG